MGRTFQVIELFHHIHHLNNEHVVHHCGGKHFEGNSRLDYEIKHCNCGKHCISKKEAIGHDFEQREFLVEFTEGCPEGGWHIESGVMVGEENDHQQRRII